MEELTNSEKLLIAWALEMVRDHMGSVMAQDADSILRKLCT